jgi:hypothetical protein
MEGTNDRSLSRRNRRIMICTVHKLEAMASILMVVFAGVGVAPVHAWAAASKPATAAPDGASGQSSDGSSEGAPRLMVTADFNRDGIADTAEAALPAGDNAGPGVLTVSLGRPGGGFQPMTAMPVLGHRPRSIVACDFNQDGIQDLIIGDDSGSLMLFLGDGTGNMVPSGEIVHLESVVSIAVADFNRDGIPDLAVSDWRSSSVTVLLGAGKGVFQRGWSFPLRMRGTTPQISAADFNGDGIPDLAVIYGDDGAYTFDVMLGSGKGTFTRSPDLSFVTDPNSHCPT